MQKNKYPLINTLQLINYNGNNLIFKKIIEKYINLISTEKCKSINDLLDFCKKNKKPKVLLINNKSMSTFIKEINNINILLEKEYMLKYNNNPKYPFNKIFIKFYPKNNITINNFIPIFEDDVYEDIITDEENELLLKNLNYQGYNLNRIETIQLSNENKVLIKQQFNLNENNIPNQIKIESLVAETDDKYYFRYKSHVFFLKKSPEIKFLNIIINNIDFDKEKYEKESGYVLKKHQIDGVKFIKYNKGGIICDDTGIGKTVQGIISSLELSKKPLVVTISEDKVKWAKEFLKFGLKSQILYDKVPKSNKKINEFYLKEFNDNEIQNDVFVTDKNNYDDNFNGVTIINYDLLPKYYKLKKGLKSDNKILLNSNFDCIICDECHKIRNNNTNRTKIIKSISRLNTVKCVIGLTATPFEKNEHVYNLFLNLNINIPTLIPDNTIDWNTSKSMYYNFMTNYCGMMYHGKIPMRRKKNGVELINDKSYELAQRIKYYFIRRTPKDVKGFPNQLTLGHKVELSLKQQQYRKKLLYNYEVKEKELKEKRKFNKKNKIEEKLATSVQLEKISELRQMYAFWGIPHTVKLIEEMLEEGKKCIVFTHFTDNEFLPLVEKLKDKALWINSNKKLTYHAIDNDGSITGSVGKKYPMSMSAIVNLFEKGYKNVLIGNILTLGTGHNLKSAHVTINNSPDWNHGEVKQSKGRNRRLDSKNKELLHFDRIFIGTEEERILNRSIDKQDNSYVLLND